ncbi:hypothetical protein [Chryseobacterium oryzae]|uniref:Uncharacterized protein n=1 Tax=Chryseobacterium oryzae TaxID=2929799 RepID=A0ABY4BIY8_9FLAO|nr:hypothetical protein [Chryseobacterium oryzae]UOE39155.1 hypothetical protein MTP08_05140 [Chryseobacterium oryzae]
MSDHYNLLETSPFSEFTVVSKGKNFDVDFDIDKELVTDLHSYCQQLIYKTFAITHSQIPDFINHHCSLAKNPLHWLNKFEKLIQVNVELFHGARNESRMMKFYTSMELKRNKLVVAQKKIPSKKPPHREINAFSDERYFSFKETKLKTYNYLTIQEQVYFLTSEIFEYRTADIELVNNKLPNFESECEKLIGKIQTLAKMKADMEPISQSLPPTLMPFSKLKINCNTNQIVDVFYQLSREMFVDGKPFIDGSVNDIIAIIANSFIDKGGLPISPLTIKTILKPSRDDKRPNSEKRIDLDDIL